MAMEKDCKVVTTLSGTEYIRALAEDGSTVRIPVAELGKVMAQVMPVATQEQHGLLNKTMFSMLDSGLTPFKGTSNTTDINQLFKECDAGLSMYTLVSAATNSPGAGFLLHFQRLQKGSMTAGSQLIYQFTLLMNGIIRYRYATPIGGEMSYSSWIDL